MKLLIFLVLIVMLLGGLINGLRALRLVWTPKGGKITRVASASRLAEANEWVERLAALGIKAQVQKYGYPSRFWVWVEPENVDRARNALGYTDN